MKYETLGILIWQCVLFERNQIHAFIQTSPLARMYKREICPNRSLIHSNPNYYFSLSRSHDISAQSGLKLKAVPEKNVDTGSSETTKLTTDVDENDKGNPLLYLTTLLPLLLVYVSNQWSRSSIYYLVNFADSASDRTAMNIDLNFSQAQYGALASVAFTALFAITSLFAGNLADKYDRKLLTLGSCCLWSAATFATGFAQSYDELVAARIIMGLGAAFTTPAAYTLIRDLFPKARTAFASSVYGSGVYFGGALASLTILLDESIGWRDTTLSIGFFGIAAAIVSGILLPSDPKNCDEFQSGSFTKGTISSNNESFMESATEVLSTSSVRWLFLASFFRFCSGLCIGVWGASFFKQTFPDDAETYAVVNALIVGICGAISGLIGGALSDYLGPKAKALGYELNTGRLAVPIIGSLLAIPAWYSCVNAESFQWAMSFLAIEYLVAECWFGPVIATLQSSVGNKGGTAQGMFTLTGAIGNLAPTALGSIYGSMKLLDSDGSSTLGFLLGSSVCFSYFLSAAGFLLSAISIESDVNES